MTTHSIEIHRTYKYWMYTDHRLEKHLHQTIDLAGIIWNHAVKLQRRYYRLTGQYISSGRLQKVTFG